MNADTIGRILTDSQAPKKLVKRVLKENDMQIVKNFTPVNSEYKLNLGKDRRVTLAVNGDEFIQKEERLINNKWRKSVEMRIKDTAENAENALIAAIELLKFERGKEIGNRILSSFGIFRK